MTVIWHNPRCSKSRQTLQLLHDRGHDPEVRLYLQDPPSAADIKAAASALGMAPQEFVRKGETLFKSLGLKGASDAELIAAMAANPILIERPIVFHKESAAIGRPPEAVLALF